MKIIKYFIILFMIVIFTKLIIITKNNKIKEFLTKQYTKKNKYKIHRGNIYDKNNILIQYTKFKYTKKKHIYTKRIYPFYSTLSVIGMVNNNGDGLSGLELYYNKDLKSQFEIFFDERLCKNDQFIGQENQFTKKNIYTTIDSLLSEKIYFNLKDHIIKLKSHYGSIIIMDGNTGAIEVLTQYPQYHPNKQIDEKFIYPLAITQSHEVGSIIKVFLMLAALEEKIVKADSLINCYGTKEKIIQGKLLTTWKAHGIIPFWQVIKESNNFGVAQLGLTLSNRLYDYYKSFGFGKKTGISLFGESSGILHHPKKWSKRTPLSMSFGYEISCSLIQLVSAWSIFINNGKRIKPRLIINQPVELINTQCSKETIQEALSILKLDQKKLKQFGLKKNIKGNLYGKTGTANLLIDNHYNKEKNSYCFVGHIEAAFGNKIIGIYINEAYSSRLLASEVALPIFIEIATLLTQ